MPALRVLYNQGNSYSKKVKNYWKELIAKMKELRYLDDWPVFPEDWRYAEAYQWGGIDAEREERNIVKREKDDEHERNH